jgi:hypothetical protein
MGASVKPFDGKEGKGLGAPDKELGAAATSDIAPAEPDPRAAALAPALQTLWGAVLPLVGVFPSRPNEFPGIFKVEAGPGKDEATVHIDIVDKPYEAGKETPMERVVSLTVKLAHDHRRLGERYFCVLCDLAPGETRH